MFDSPRAAVLDLGNLLLLYAPYLLLCSQVKLIGRQIPAMKGPAEPMDASFLF